MAKYDVDVVRRGAKLGAWTVVGESPPNKHGMSMVLCRCECGISRPVLKAALRQGRSKSCGCRKVDHLTGRRFGRLVVLARCKSRGRHRTAWKCQCDCGNKTTVLSDNLKSGGVRSCGCVKGSHRLSGSPEYKIWAAMKARCNLPANSRYPDYGGRGISVCPRWEGSFEAFLADMGRRPSLRHSIERKNNNGDYEPSNCCWLIVGRQQRNTRRNRHISCGGKTMILVEWSEFTGIKPGTIASRLRRGWSVGRALGFEL